MFSRLPSKKVFLASVLVTIFFFSEKVYSQSNRILTLSEISYEYIKRLQHRGILLELNPTSLPYKFSDVKEAIDKVDPNKLSGSEIRWFNLIKKRVNSSVSIRYGEITNETTLSDTKRLNTLEPLRSNFYVYPKANISAGIGDNTFVANANLTHSLYYDQDPDGIDSGDRLYIRPEDTYVGYKSKSGFEAFLGRYDHHWAPYKESSTILSNNARSFDKLSLGYYSQYFSVQSILGELDNINSNGIFSGKALEEGAQRRYIAAHRIDWKPKKNFRLTYFESIIYSGFNSGISLKYINPLYVFGFVSSNNPINDDANLLIGGALWWQIKKTTFNIQALLDDIHVEDKDEVTTFSLFGSVNIAEAILKSTDIGIEFEAVAYQTYNSPQAEGRYLYLRRGIATQNTDYVLSKIYSKIYLEEIIPGLEITPSLTYYLQGEQIINQTIVRTNSDGSLIDIILTGEVEKTLRAGVNIFYSPHPNLWFQIDTGYNKIDNFMNTSGIANNRFSTIAKIGFRLGLYTQN